MAAAYINQRWFDQPGTLARAMGFPTPKPIGYQGEEDGRKNGGITSWHRFVLPSGTTIIRFGQKRLSERRPSLSASGLFGGAIQGEWWLEQAEFLRIERYAAEDKISVGLAMRRLCVIPDEWSSLDILIKAQLKQPLISYRGSPNPAFSRSGGQQKIERDNHHYLIKQLFIPGLGNGDVVHDALMIGQQEFRHQKEARR